MWFSLNDDIRKYLLQKQRSWTKNAFRDVNNKKWHKRCKFVSPLLFNNPYGLPALTMGAKCPNQIFYVWLVDLVPICAIKVLATWLTAFDGVRICLLDMQRCWNKNAIGNLKCKKWCIWFILVSSFLFNNRFGIPVLTKSTICPNQVFYSWLVDLQIICA
jgi:hypothetical protein